MGRVCRQIVGFCVLMCLIAYLIRNIPYLSHDEADFIQKLDKAWKSKIMTINQYPRQIEKLTTAETLYQWRKDGKLNIGTKALLTAAQDQALHIKAHKTFIMKIWNDPKCRLCGKSDETVSHLLSSCKSLANYSQYSPVNILKTCTSVAY